MPRQGKGLNFYPASVQFCNFEQRFEFDKYTEITQERVVENNISVLENSEKAHR